MKIYKFNYLLYESNKEVRFNNVLKNLGVMDTNGKINLDNMSKKINDFLSKPENKEEFLKTIKKDIRPNVEIEKTKVRSMDLRPSQDQIFLDHIFSRLVIQDDERDQILNGVLKERNILISSDNHIIDGHHRWSSTMLINPNCKIKCTQVNLPIEHAVPIIDAILTVERGKDVGFGGKVSLNVYDIIEQKPKDEVMKMIDNIVMEAIHTGIEIGAEDKVEESLVDKTAKDGEKFYKEIKKKLNLTKHPLEYFYDNLKKLPKPQKILLNREEMPNIKLKDAEKYL
jgi:hypothetical protein